jgi:hypothetical protein
MDLSIELTRFNLFPDGAKPMHTGKTKAKRGAEYSVDMPGGVKVSASPDQVSAQEVKEFAEQVRVLSAER